MIPNFIMKFYYKNIQTGIHQYKRIISTTDQYAYIAEMKIKIPTISGAVKFCKEFELEELDTVYIYP